MIVPIIFFINYKILFKDEFNKIIFILFVLNIGFIISAYMFREMEIVYSLRTTMDRIIFTSSGMYVFYLINFLKAKIIIKNISYKPSLLDNFDLNVELGLTFFCNSLKLLKFEYDFFKKIFRHKRVFCKVNFNIFITKFFLKLFINI